MITKYPKFNGIDKANNKIFKVIDIVLGNKCYLSCEYCYQNKSIMKKDITNDNVNLIISYINDIIKKLPNNQYVEIHIMGGEPFLYIEHIDFIIKKLMKYKRYISHVRIPTNGTLIEKYLNDILFWNTLLDGKLCIMVSNDFYLQNKNRCNTHDIVKNAIKILDEKDIHFTTHTVINYDDIENISEIYLEYKNQIKNLNKKYQLDFTLDLYKNNIDIKKIDLGFSKLNKILLNNDTLSGIRQYDNIYYRTECRMYGGLLVSIDTDGIIYPCSSAPFIKNNDLLQLGNIKENNFSSIEEKIKNFLNQYKFYEYDETCMKCKNYCMTCPIKKYGIKENINICNDKFLCQANKIITKYIREYQEVKKIE